MNNKTKRNLKALLVSIYATLMASLGMVLGSLIYRLTEQVVISWFINLSLNYKIFLTGGWMFTSVIIFFSYLFIVLFTCYLFQEKTGIFIVNHQKLDNFLFRV